MRKEAKESAYWLRITKDFGNPTVNRQLTIEADELLRIFSSIIRKKL